MVRLSTQLDEVAAVTIRALEGAAPAADHAAVAVGRSLPNGADPAVVAAGQETWKQAAAMRVAKEARQLFSNQVDRAFYEVAHDRLSEDAWHVVAQRAFENRTPAMQEAAIYFNEGARKQIGIDLYLKLKQESPEVLKGLGYE